MLISRPAVLTWQLSVELLMDESRLNECNCSWLQQCISVISLLQILETHLFPEVRTKLLISELVKLRKNTLICGYPYKSFISMPVYFLIPFHAIILGKIVHRNTLLYFRIKCFSVTKLRTAGIFSTVLILYRITPI